MDSSECYKHDERILLARLPEVAWRLIFGSLGANFSALETCLEATDVFRSHIFGNGQVSLGIEEISPSVIRQWIERDDTKKDNSHSEPMLLLFSLLKLQPKITVFEIFVDPNFRPENRVVNSFLKLHFRHLEILHISCMGLESEPLVLDLTNVEMKLVRDLKIARSDMKEILMTQKSLRLHMPVYESFPALEKLTLSLWDCDKWPEFFGFSFISSVTSVRHVQFFGSERTMMRNSDMEHREVGLLVLRASLRFPNLLSLEIPTTLFDNPLAECWNVKNLKRLTLTLPQINRHRHVFDMFITGHLKEICAALYADPTRDYDQVCKEVWETAEQNGDFFTMTELLRRTFSPWRALARKPVANLNQFTNLEVFCIKSESAEWGPTIVSCGVLLSMKSLKILDLGGIKPIHIPDAMMEKMRQRFTVLCG